MNYRVLGRILGLALVTEAALMVPSMLIGLYHLLYFCQIYLADFLSFFQGF